MIVHVWAPATKIEDPVPQKNIAKPNQKPWYFGPVGIDAARGQFFRELFWNPSFSKKRACW